MVALTVGQNLIKDEFGCEVCDTLCVPVLFVGDRGKRFTSRQWQAESINNFGRKYNFEHKTQSRAGAYQNTLRDFGIFSKYVNGKDRM